MHIIKDDDPLLRSRPFNPVSGSTITVGTISKIANSLAESRETMSKLAAKLDGALDDLSARIASVEAEVKAAVADAGGDGLAKRLARLESVADETPHPHAAERRIRATSSRRSTRIFQITMTDPTVETAALARAIRQRLARLPASRVKQALAEQCDEIERRLGALTGSARRSPPPRNPSPAVVAG